MPRRVWDTFRARLLSGFAWNLLVTGSSQGSLFLTHLIVARALGVSDFGRYALLLTTALAVSAIAQSGVGFVAAKYVAEYHLTVRARASRVLSLCRFSALALGGVCSLVLWLGASSVATRLFEQPEMGYWLRVLSLSIPFLALNVYQVGALQGFGAFRESGLASVLSGVVHVASASVGALSGGLAGVLLALVFSAAIRCAVFAIALTLVQSSHQIQSPLFGFGGEAHLLWRIGLPSALMGATSSIAFWLVNVMLAQGPSGPESVGHFYAANQIRLLALQLPTILTGVSVSVLNRLRGQADAHTYRRVYISNLTINVVVGAMLAGLVALLSVPLLSLYGGGFADSRSLLQWLALSIVFELIAIALYLHVQAQEKLWLPLYVVWLPKDLVFVGMSALLLDAFGPVAPAIAYVVSWCFAAAVFGALVARIGFKGNVHQTPRRT